MSAEKFYEQMRKNGLTEDITSNESPNYNLPFYQSIFRLMEEFSKSEFEEKNKWIKVKNDYTKTDLQEDILIKFKSSLNREVIVVGHIFQGRFYMNYSNDAHPLKNVISWRSFL